MQELRFRLALIAARRVHSRYIFWNSCLFDLVWYLQKLLDPTKVPLGYMNPAYLESAREKMGFTEEKFYGELNQIHKEREREDIGLPKEK